MTREMPEWTKDTPTADHRAGTFPVPGAWVLGVADGDGTVWRRYPRLATADHERERDIETTEALPSPETVASLDIDDYEVGSGFDSEILPENSFKVEGREVFCVRDADYHDVMETIAEALDRLDRGEDVEGLRPETGETVVNEQEDQREEIEQRREANTALTQFTSEKGGKEDT